MQTLLKGGTVVLGTGRDGPTLHIDSEKNRSSGAGAGWRRRDGDRCHRLPALPRLYRRPHPLSIWMANTTTADDFLTGSLAALRGGTTTVIDFACPNKGESLHYGLDLWHRKADGRTFCDYGFHMTIDDWNESIRAELPDMFAAGISSFKMYLTYPAMMIGDRDIYWALKELKGLGGIAGSTVRTPASSTA